MNLSLNMRVAKAVVFPDGLWLDDGEKEVTQRLHSAKR